MERNIFRLFAMTLLPTALKNPQSNVRRIISLSEKNKFRKKERQLHGL